MVPHFTEMSKTKNGKAGEAGIDMISDLVNQIAAEGVIPTEWELSTCKLL